MAQAFNRLTLGAPFPGRCVRCHNVNDLVDLGAPEIQSYGTVLLCTVCIGELVDGMGFIHRDTAARQLQLAQLQATTLERELLTRPTLPDTRYEGLTHALADLAARFPVGGAPAGAAVPDLAPGDAGTEGVAGADDGAAAGAERNVDDAGVAGGGDAEGADGVDGEGAGDGDGARGQGGVWDLLDRDAADGDD